MPPTQIIDVLAEVFRTHGFDTTAPAHPEDGQGETHRVELLAEKDGIDVLVTTASDPEATPREIQHIGHLRERLGSHYALVATPFPLDETALATSDSLLAAMSVTVVRYRARISASWNIDSRAGAASLTICRTGRISCSDKAEGAVALITCRACMPSTIAEVSAMLA